MLTFCPLCDSRNLGDCWVGPGRKLQQYCHECSWRGSPRVPEQKLVLSTKEVIVGQFYGFHYEIFDCFGHLMVSSRTYTDEKEAEQNLQLEIERGKKDVNAGPYTAVLWPATVQVTGKVFVGGT